MEALLRRSAAQSMVRKSGYRFSEKTMLKTKRKHDGSEFNEIGSDFIPEPRGPARRCGSRRTAPRTPAAAPCRPPAMRHGMPEVGEAGHAVARSATPQGTMPEKCDRSGSTLSAMPCRLTQRLQPDADGGDLVLAAGALVGPAHPDADAVLAPLAAHVEGRRACGSAIPPASPRSGARRARGA